MIHPDHPPAPSPGITGPNVVAVRVSVVVMCGDRWIQQALVGAPEVALRRLLADTAN